jgi:hypothetical protein
MLPTGHQTGLVFIGRFTAGPVEETGAERAITRAQAAAYLPSVKRKPSGATTPAARSAAARLKMNYVQMKLKYGQSKMRLLRSVRISEIMALKA